MVSQYRVQYVLLTTLKKYLVFAQHCYVYNLKYGLIRARAQINTCVNLMLNLGVVTKTANHKINNFITTSNYIGCSMYIYIMLHQLNPKK